jgi:hypothetical protein
MVAAERKPPLAPEPDTKLCPDCAEAVLAPARKCRFCGYRFDQPRPGAVLGVLQRLGLWRPRRQASFEEVLADWGIAMAPDETTACFRYVSVDHQRGYLLVTDCRMLFVADHRRDQAPVFEYAGALIRTVEILRGGRTIRVQAGTGQHLIRTGRGRTGKAIGSALGALSHSSGRWTFNQSFGRTAGP